MRYYHTLTVLALAGHALARPDGVGGHHGHHTEHGAASAPAVASSGYGAPDAGYGAPDAGYSSPDAGYAAPDAGYGAPDAGYSAPGGDYYAPSATGGFADDSILPSLSGSDGMGMILVPLLIVAALFLLFPSVVNVPVNGTGRKRREAADEPASNMVERIQDMYMAILESEECIERVVCEMGGLVEDAGYSKQMTKTLEMFAPKKYAKMMKSFNAGKDCKKNNKCGLF
jgi:hypothetical protein